MSRENLTKEELLLKINELEEELRESEQNLQDLYDTSLDWFWETDAELRFTTVTNRYFEITGVPVEDVIGKTRMELVSDNEQLQHEERWKQHIDDMENRRPFRNLEYTITGANGKTAHVRINGKPIYNAKGEFTGFAGSGTDETDRVEVQNALEHAKTQLLQSEKLASVGQLAAGIAHEINTPLGAIGLNIEALGDYVSTLIGVIDKLSNDFLADNKKLISQLEELYEEIDYDYLKEDLPDLISQSKDSVERVSQIITGLKNFALEGEHNWLQMDVNKALDTALEYFQAEFKDRISIVSNHGDIPNIQGIPNQLDQVFLCLLLNAVQAIEKEGSIEVTTYLNEDENEVAVEVKDDGVGMDEATLTKIYEPFYTTKDVGSGTGLGLSMAYGVINAHQGSIDVESTLGVGSTFRVRLPVNQS